MQDALTTAVRVLVENGELHQADAVLGRYLTRLPAWTPGHGKAAMRMVSKYVARLRGYGIRVADLLGATVGEDRTDGTDETDRVDVVAGKRVGVNCTAFTVRFPRSGEFGTLLEAVKLLPSARWDGERGEWRVGMTVAGAERLCEFAETYGFGIEPEFFVKVDELTGAAVEAVAASREEAARYEVEGLHRVLRPYQQAGVKYLVETAKGRALICDEMGLGKTVESLAAVQALGAWPLLVICPASLRYNWEREIRETLNLEARLVTDLRYAECFRKAKGKDRLELVGPNEYNTEQVSVKVAVINYDRLEAWGDVLRKVKWGAVIVDESHYCKDAKAKRTLAVRKLVRGVPVRFALTGTPVVNQVAELIPQLAMVGRLDELGGFWHFAERYCGAHKKRVRQRTKAGVVERYVWDLSGRTNAGELHERLRAACFLRRIKKHVLAELPPKMRATVPIELDNWEEYRRAEEDVVRWLAGRAAADREFQGTIAHLPESERREREEERHLEKAAQLEGAEALVRFEALKQLSVKGKLAAATAWIANFLESGEKLGVFAEHVEVVKGLAKHFGAPAIMGDTPAKERQAIVDRFQNDPTCKLVVCNIKAGGVGLTLTAASNCAFLELPWTAAAVDQAEDRFHRFGQRKSVTCYFLMGKQTVDWKIYGVIREKREASAEVVDGKGAMDGSAGATLRAVAAAYGRGGERWLGLEGAPETE